ncbi:MAG: peptidoglycan DD-metalloendopeptidase family protein [Magnetospiraceae bacterium]
MRGDNRTGERRTAGWPTTVAIAIASFLAGATFMGGPDQHVEATVTGADPAPQLPAPALTTETDPVTPALPPVDVASLAPTETELDIPAPAPAVTATPAAGSPKAENVSAAVSMPALDDIEDIDTGLPADQMANTFADPAADAQNRTPSEPGGYSQTLTVGKGDTLIKMLVKAGVSRQDAYAAVSAMESVHSARLIRPGQEIDLHLSLPVVEPAADLEAELGSDDEDEDIETADTLESMVLTLGLVDSVVITRTEDGFTATTESKPVVTHMSRAAGTIDSSLYTAAREADLPAGALMEMIRIYSWDVDFQREIQPGDKFEVMYDYKTTEDGQFVGSGDVLYAKLELSGQIYPLYRFETKDGQIAHFDEKGRGAKKPLMRTPIDGARLSSGFGFRKHPILGYNKKHTGVDFAAPKGTPIYAAGDGRLTFRGRKGGYGNYIQIRHNGEFSTAYAHLSRFKKSVQNGSRVKQGQVIGYVGTTGRSTGPHLHYEIIRNGKKVNPMKVRLPAGFSLEGKDLARFKQIRDQIDDQYLALKHKDGATVATAD